jgi:branched-chain amino acid transport system permease protein
MEISPALLLNAIVAGLLLGGLYAAMSVGISISFGMLDVVNIAHPGFIILGAYIAYIVNSRYGFDPIAVAIILSPLFFLLGRMLYRVYYVCFEKRGQESLRGLAFFFGILFITEVALILVFGVDYRTVSGVYTDVTWRLGMIDLPLRLVVPFLVSLAMVIGLQLFLTHTFFGRAVLAVAQDQLALRLMGVDPVRVKELAFALSIATAGIAGALLIVIQPLEPSIGREYIGLVFAVCVLGGMGSIWGTLLGAFVLGLAESFTSTYFGPSWAPAVSFGMLLLTLAFRPSGFVRPMSNPVFAAVAFAVALALAAGCQLVPNEFFFSAAYTVLLYVILATAWNILGGYTGYVNFGSAAFFAIGAYTTVALYYAFKLPLAVTMPAGTAVAGLAGLGLGYLTLRLRGVFFAIASLALAVVSSRSW